MLFVDKFKNLKYNRYKKIDSIVLKILNTLGANNAIKLQNSKLIKKIKFLHIINSLLIFKIKTTFDDNSLVPSTLFQNVKSRYLHYSYADWLLKHRDYGDLTEFHFLKAYEKNKEINVNLRISDFISQKYGYKSDKLKRVIARLSAPEAFRNLNKSQRLRLSIMLYQQERDFAASRILKGIGKPFILKHTSSPYIYNKLIKNNIFTDPYILRGDEQYKKILKSRNDFTRLIINSVGDFCIVGNAPTEINSGNGRIIDSKKVVIRINNYSLDYPDDYGTKENVWIRVTNNEVTNINLKNNHTVIFAANNFAIKRRDADKYLLAPYLMDKNYTVIPNHIYKSLIGKLNGLPSTGLAIAYWVYTLTGKIPRESLFGFTHFHQDRSFKDHYYNDETKIGTHLHEWDKERAIFEQITE